MARKKTKFHTPDIPVHVAPDPCQGCRHFPKGMCDIVGREPDEALQKTCIQAGWREVHQMDWRQERHSASTGDHAVALEIAR